jgi:hypothetical protein
MTLSEVKNLILISLDLDTIIQKRDQAPKNGARNISKMLCRNDERGYEYIPRKITGTLLHWEDSYFRINNRQIGHKKKKD